MSSDALIIRNFQLMKNIFDNNDILVTYYKLTKKEICLIQELCMKHHSYKAFIECNPKDFSLSHKSLYRVLNKLENKNVLNIVSKPSNQYSLIQVYFTIKFIQIVCDEEFADLYEKWLAWRKEDISLDKEM